MDEATLDDLVQGRLSGQLLHEAEAHLDGCPLCSDVVSVLAGGAPPAAGEIEPGARVGKHVVSSLIGRGAMGVVYAAEDPELGRRVALKLIRPGAGPDAAERALREAQSLARLAHPNVVAIYEVGRALGALYFAMELVSGKTLRAWLSEPGRSARETLDVLLQAGEGLRAAHSAGIVHRDFKPDNVMVGDDGRVRVTDFGLARLSGASYVSAPDLATQPVSTLVTRTGKLVGTPAYMAPELLAGGEATELSDQFAYGVTLYEALAGARPFTGSSIAELAQSVARGASAEPLRASPGPLRAAVLRALRERPEDRYPSLEALLRDVARFGRPRRRWPLAVGLGAPLAAAAVVAGVWIAGTDADTCSGGKAKVSAVWNDGRKESIRGAFGAAAPDLGPIAAARVGTELDRVAKALSLQHRAACEATHVEKAQSEAILDARMRCLDRQLAEIGALVESFEAADVPVVEGAIQATETLASPAECGEVESLAAIDPRPTDTERAARLSKLEREIGEVKASGASGRYAPALERAARLAEEATDLGYRPAVAEIELVVAQLARKLADYERASASARRALSTAEAARADRLAARAWLEVLAIDGERGDPARVIENAGLAAATFARLDDPPELRGALLLQVGIARTAMGALEEAGPDLDEALEIHEGVHGPESLVVARTLTALGNLARARGQHEEALELHGRALSIDAGLLGAGHPALAAHHHNRAGVLRLLGRHDEARAQYGEALELEVAALGAQHPRVGLTHNSLGLLSLETGDLVGARRHLGEALGIFDATDHPDRALALLNLGVVEAREGRHREATGHLTGASEIVARVFGRDHLRRAAILLERARSRRSLGEVAGATEDLAEAARVARVHAKRVPEAARLEKEIAAEAAVAVGPAARAASPASPSPTSPQAPKPVGSMGYGPATSWDAD